MTSSGRGEGDQVKNGQNQMKVDDYRQGGGWDVTHRNGCPER